MAFLIRSVRDEYNEYKLVRLAIPVCLAPPFASALVWVLKTIWEVSIAVKILNRAIETCAVSCALLNRF
jgi:hypothetical protein